MKVNQISSVNIQVFRAANKPKPTTMHDAMSAVGSYVPDEEFGHYGDVWQKVIVDNIAYGLQKIRNSKYKTEYTFSEGKATKFKCENIGDDLQKIIDQKSQIIEGGIPAYLGREFQGLKDISNIEVYSVKDDFVYKTEFFINKDKGIISKLSTNTSKAKQFYNVIAFEDTNELCSAVLNELKRVGNIYEATVTHN